jgi:hypothetical protein
MESCTCGASLSYSWIGKLASVVTRAPINQFFKGVNCTCMLCGVDAMVMQFNELEADLLRSEVSLDHFCCLIIYYIYLWFVTFAGEIFEVFSVCGKNAGVIKTWDGNCKDGVCFVVIHHKKTDVSIKGHERRFAGTVVINDSGGFVYECTKTEYICYRMVVDVIDEVREGSVLGAVFVFVFNVKIGHGRIRYNIGGGKAGDFWCHATQAFAWAFHMAFGSCRAWREILAHSISGEMWHPTEESLADGGKQQ